MHLNASGKRVCMTATNSLLGRICNFRALPTWPPDHLTWGWAGNKRLWKLILSQICTFCLLHLGRWAKSESGSLNFCRFSVLYIIICRFRCAADFCFCLFLKGRLPGTFVEFPNNSEHKRRSLDLQDSRQLYKWMRPLCSARTFINNIYFTTKITEKCYRIIANIFPQMAFRSQSGSKSLPSILSSSLIQLVMLRLEEGLGAALGIVKADSRSWLG